ncbi:MAG: FxLYD domain-containing protein [Candidatus Acidiferrales bacterium]
MEPGESSYSAERRRFPLAFLLGILIVSILFGGFVLMTRHMRGPAEAAAVKLPFGPAEQSYAARIHFTDIQMARATNFLKQEFTYVAGTISNDGVQSIGALQVAVEFHDDLNQVILRETEVLIPPHSDPLPAGQRRDFQITLEPIPAEWNHQYPSVTVTGLILQ